MYPPPPLRAPSTLRNSSADRKSSPSISGRSAFQIYPATYTDFEIDFFLTPTVNKGDARRSMLNEHVFGLTTKSTVPDAAFKSLAWFCGREMKIQGLLQGQKGPIARADVWSDERLYDTIPTYAKLRPVMESIEADYLVANLSRPGIRPGICTGL